MRLTRKAIVAASWLGGSAAAALIMAAPTQAAALNLWQFDPNTHQLVITLPRHVTPKYHVAAEPARIIVDLPDVDLGTVSTQQAYPGAVRQIRVAQFQPGLTRIVLELSPEAVLTPDQVELQQLDASDTTQRWVLRPLLVADTARSAASPSVAQSAAPALPAAPTANSISSPVLNHPVGSSVSPATNSNSTISSGQAGGFNRAASSNQAVNPRPLASATSTRPDSAIHSGKLPPLEPGAVEIPVEMPSQAFATPAPRLNPAVASPPVAPLATNLPNQSNPPAAPFSATPPAQAVASAPLPVDFATPLTDIPSGTAASLTVSGVGQSPAKGAARGTTAAQSVAQSALQPSGSVSFPTPTSEAVSVPSVSTIATPMPNPDNQADPAGRRTARTRPTPTVTAPASPSASASQPTPFPAPVATPAPATVPSPVSPALPSSTQVTLPSAPVFASGAAPVAFGQPLPAQQPHQVTLPTMPTTPVAENVVRFRQSSPAGSPAVQASPRSARPKVEVIQFGQPLPGRPSS